ncbi:MAG: MarR family winged helix-turn-helix transcriptional regulator [Paracoccus sp. (in: a-proteobacteria)]|uniref:MarR family winged helix-turn-helix transcriptional regulator n=1 Tax=Paracoccus sp. TaxID=267 RepID=UPI0026E0FB5D|nr:MarR family winged helix-turn-helix transcriptional regulator [Paracoccus sp. (in: a-proteobacteria)]MDO5614124.1 MarR family winged helix-turn-helix transcriptional regulator [Paracoccus sp. (in: a-proteobacteria)]
MTATSEPPLDASPGDDERITAAPAGSTTTPLGDAIDPDNFTPRLVSLLSNKLVWRESRLLRERFDLGTNDWRIISALGTRPGATVTEIADFIAVNKAIVSKSVAILLERGLVASSPLAGRSRPLYLTAEGAAMHAQMLPISMSGQHYILDGLDAGEVERFNALLRAMLARTDEPGFRGDGSDS